MTQAKQTPKVLPLVEMVFEKDLTQEGLKEIIERFPKDEVHDLTDDEKFKDARKIRTEKNKVVKAINDKRISFTGEVKKYADDLIASVEDAYDPIVSAFELEDKRRKELKEEEERKHNEMLAKLREEIEGIKNFITEAQGQDCETIANIIESVDLIETDHFHKDVIHDAIEAKKETLAKLHKMYASTKAQAELEKEREAVEAQRQEQEKKAKIEQRINNLRNKPMEFFGKPSAEVKAYIDQLSVYTPTEEVFAERTQEVIALKEQSLGQLNMMYQQACQLEQMQATAAPVEQTETEEPQDQVEPQEEPEQETQKEPVNEPGSLLGETVKSEKFEKVIEKAEEPKQQAESAVPEELLNDLALFCDEAGLSLMESEKLGEIVSKYF